MVVSQCGLEHFKKQVAQPLGGAWVGYVLRCSEGAELGPLGLGRGHLGRGCP